MLLTIRAFVCGVILAGGSAGPASTGYHEARSLDEALAVAAKNHALVVVDYWSQNCPPCRAFAKHVEDNVSVKSALEGLVLLKVELTGDRERHNQYNVHQFPTFALMNADGQLLATWIGYPGPEAWVDRIGAVKADPVTVEQRRQRFERNENFGDAWALGMMAYSQGRMKVSYDYLTRAAALDPEAAGDTGVPMDLFRVTFYGVGTGDFTVDECMAEIRQVLGDDQVEAADALFIADKTLGVKEYIGDAGVIAILQMVNAALPADIEEDQKNELQEFRIEYTWLVEKNAEEALRLKRLSMDDGWDNDYRELNSFAWWCVERRINLDEAEAIARRAVESAPSGPNKASCYDTLAEVLYAKGDRDEAARLIRMAVAEDPDGRNAEYYKRQLSKFQDRDGTSAQ